MQSNRSSYSGGSILAVLLFSALIIGGVCLGLCLHATLYPAGPRPPAVAGK